MDTNNVLSRRALLKAAPAGTGVTLLPISQTAAEEEPGDRLNRLMQEISVILDDQLMGTFCAVIEPSKTERAQVSLKPITDVRNAFALAHFTDHAPHHSIVEYHLMGICKAMREQHGGCWVAAAQHAGGAHVYRDPHAREGVWVSFPVEGV